MEPPRSKNFPEEKSCFCSIVRAVSGYFGLANARKSLGEVSGIQFRVRLAHRMAEKVEFPKCLDNLALRKLVSGLSDLSLRF